MERLTFEGNFCDIAQCDAIPGGSYCESGSCTQRKVWERLKQFEDKCESPEVLAKAMDMEEILGDKYYSVDRMLELLKADKDGRLVVLPCKDWLDVVFGDQVLFWGIDKDYVEQPIREISLDDADRVGWYDGYKTVFLKGTDENGEAWEFYPEEIGKSVFLTREEAGKALEAMKDGY